jgi:hypothetical protein
MAKKFQIRLECIAILSMIAVCPSAGFASDPVVRRHLRNIDENPAKAVATTGPSSNQFETLFDRPVFSPPSEFRGAESRKWLDNTGAYEVEGRLVMIYPDKIRLQKENGRTTTVAMRRLSPVDQAYVRWVADQMTRTDIASTDSSR